MTEEDRGSPAVALGGDPVQRLRRRLQLIACAAFVAVLPWTWQAGRIAPDTKLDLVVSPWRYLLRAAGAWDAHSGFGQLQNQAYGYLMPMGPVFGVARSLGVPEWGTQRLWWSILLVVAFLGVERLLRMLGTEFGPATVLPALAYAFSPRILTVVSEISVEAWPMALCPWFVVVALAALRDGASPRALRLLAGRTGLLMAVTGGVNATASLVVVLAPLLLLVTAPRGSRRPKLTAWWSAGVVLGSLWWLLPLLVTGRYAYPFLNFIETASVTTSVTSVGNVLRGTSHWVAYVTDAFGRPVWQSGWELAQSPFAIMATTAVAACGLVGLLREAPDHWGRRPGQVHRRHVRRFACVSLLIGTLLMTSGHSGPFASPVAAEVRALLDGPFAAFRNVHKADPLVRLPIVIGLWSLLQLRPGRLAARIWSELTAERRSEVVRRWLAVALAGLIAVSAFPVLQGSVVSNGAFGKVPTSWRQAAEVVDTLFDESGGSTLLLPASGSADYVWGRPEDEPLSALARSPVMVRNDVPLGTPGSTRILDVIELQAGSGHRQPGLARALVRMGVARVLVRNDLAVTAQAQDAALVERTLERSPGFRQLELPRPARKSMSLWAITLPRTQVDSYAAQDATAVGGGPEAVPLLSAADIDLTGRALLMGDDVESLPDGEVRAGIATDTLRRRFLNPGRSVVSHYSPTLDDRQKKPATLPATDLPPGDGTAPRTVRRWIGLEALDASDDAATPFGYGYRSVAHGVSAAVDEDLSTSWLSSGRESTARLTLRFAHTVPNTALHLLVAGGQGVAAVDAVDVAAGDLRLRREVIGRRLTFPLDEATGDTLRITLHRSVDGETRGVPVGLTDVRIDGHPVGSALELARPAAGSTIAHLVVRDPLVRLDPARNGEEPATLKRLLHRPSAATMQLQATVQAVDGPQLRRLVSTPWTVTGSSVAGGTTRNWPGAALDHNPDTSWVVRADDLTPTLELRARTPQRIAGVEVSSGKSKRLLGVVVQADGKSFELPPEGGPLPMLRTDRVTISFQVRPNLRRFPVPEVTVGGAGAKDRVALACGEAGAVLVGETVVPLRSAPSRIELGQGSPVEAQPCLQTPLTLPAGEVPVTAEAAAAVQVHSVLLMPRVFPEVVAQTSPPPRVVEWTDARRVVDTGSGPARIVAFDEGFNEGWAAHIGGEKLTPIRVDGWRQGFVVPADRGGRLVATFVPDHWYRWGIIVGAGAALVALLLLAASRRTPANRNAERPEQAAIASSARPRGWPSGSRWRWVGRLGLPGGVGLLVGGPYGLLVGVAAGCLPLRALVAAAGTALVLAGAVRATVAGSSGSEPAAGWGQLLALLAVCCVAASLVTRDQAHRGSLDDVVADGRDADR